MLATPHRVDQNLTGNSDDEIAKWCSVSRHSGTFTETGGWDVKAEVEACELGNVGGGQAWEKGKVVIAEDGRRIEVHAFVVPHLLSMRGLTFICSDKVKEFFQTKILPVEGVKDTLKTWMSASRSEYVLEALKLKTTPQIWCLTGLIELSAVTAATFTKKTPSAKFGISSALVGALTSVPIGGSICLDRNFDARYDSYDPDKLVWAAQFQLVNAKRVLKTKGSQPPPINYLELYPDWTYSSGKVLAGGDGHNMAFEVEMEDEYATIISEDEWSAEYWQTFEKTQANIKTFSHKEGSG